VNYWDTQASDFGVLSLGADNWERVHDYQVRLLQERLPDKHGRVLEIGGGVGRLGIPLAKENPDLFFTNYDTSEEMLKEFTKRSKDVENIVGCDTLTTGLRFDLVFCVLVIQHNDLDSVNKLMSLIVLASRPYARILVQFVRGDKYTAHGPRSFDYSMEQIETFLPGAKFFKDESGYADSWWWAEIQ